VSPRVARPLLLGLITLAVACAPRVARACDSSSCLLVTRGGNGLLGKRAWRVDFSYRFTPMTELLRGSESVSEVLRPKIDFENRRLLPGFHDELGGHDNFLQLDVAYGLFGRTSLFVSMPVRATRDFDIGHLPVQRETYSTVGNGDVLLGVRHALFQRANDSLVGGLMLELPAGKYTLTAPTDRVDRGILDPMLQPGTGSVDLGATLQYGRRLGGTWDTVGAASYQVYTTNDLDFRSGADFIASYTASRPVYGALGGSLQLKFMHKDRSDFMGEPVPNTGGHFLYLVPGLSVRAPLKLAVYGYAVVPLYRYVNEAQLAPKTGVVLGLSRSF
jgi:Putative MetA-pathway of phenol degradation